MLKIRKFLVRRRTFFSLVVPLGLLVFAHPRQTWLVPGFCLAAVGEGLRIWAAGYLIKSEQLITAGPFSYVRNPLYLGSLLIAIGYCFMSGHLLAFPLVLALYFLFFTPTILQEERLLREKFGREYAEYESKTRRFLPSLKPCCSSQGQFSWQRLLTNREHRTALGVLALSILFWVRLYG